MGVGQKAAAAWIVAWALEASEVRIEWDDSVSHSAWADAERWAHNESISMRHHHKGTLSLCPQLEELVPKRSPAIARPARSEHEKMAWFMSIAKPDDAVSQTYVKFVKAATVSAKLNAPSLAPYFVYTFLPQQRFEDTDDELVTWLRAAGTRVIKWRLSFWEAIPEKVRSSKQGHINVGAFGRLDVPLVVSTLLDAELKAQGISTHFVLYTDADVMFAQDWPSRWELLKCVDCRRGWPHPQCCRKPLEGENDPEVFLAGTEVFAIWGLNSGVMLMNVQAWLRDRPQLLAFANDNSWKFMMYDQGLLDTFYRRVANRTNSAYFKRRGNHAWDSFDDALYNARGFMRFTSLATRPGAPAPFIWHWHGFKPYDIACWLEQLEAGTWDLQGDVRSQIQRSQKFGCRGLLNPRMIFPDCSLSLYFSLYANYLRLLKVADMIEQFPSSSSSVSTNNTTTNSV